MLLEVRIVVTLWRWVVTERCGGSFCLAFDLNADYIYGFSF